MAFYHAKKGFGSRRNLTEVSFSVEVIE
jgi:hypothetical protein